MGKCPGRDCQGNPPTDFQGPKSGIPKITSPTDANEHKSKKDSKT